jgi:hypothetical protein
MTIRAQHSMTGRARGRTSDATPRPAAGRIEEQVLTARHLIDYLEGACPSDTVNSEVNDDSYRFFAHHLPA